MRLQCCVPLGGPLTIRSSFIEVSKVVLGDRLSPWITTNLRQSWIAALSCLSSSCLAESCRLSGSPSFSSLFMNRWKRPWISCMLRGMWCCSSITAPPSRLSLLYLPWSFLEYFSSWIKFLWIEGQQGFNRQSFVFRLTIGR